MKTLTLALSLALSAPALAADKPAAGTPAQLCSSYSRQTTRGLLRLLSPAIKLALTDRKVPAKQWTAANQCIAGGLPTLQRAVVESCLVAQDPTETLVTALGPGVEPCLTQTADKPVFIFPGAAAADDSSDAVSRDSTLKGTGLLPYLGLEAK
jgi:hypothetical protein